MGLGLRIGQLVADSDQLLVGHGGLLEALPQGAAVDVFENEVRPTVVKRAGGENVDDVGMPRQPAEGLALAIESKADYVILYWCVPNLDRNLSVDVRLAGQPNIAEASTANAFDRLKAV